MQYITPKLETDRLILKRGSKEDYIKVYEYDYNTLRFSDADVEAKRFKLSKTVAELFYSPREYLIDMFDWIIYLKDTNNAIGNITAFNIDRKNSSIRVLYNLHLDYLGEGYMNEALLEVMNYLFNNGFDNVIYGYKECNIKTRELIESVGFDNYKEVVDYQEKKGEPIFNNTDYYTFTNDILLKKIKR